MTKVTESERPIQKNSRPTGSLVARGSHFLSIALLLGGALVGFTYRGHIDHADIVDSNRLVLQFRSENQKLTSQIADLNAKLDALQTKLGSVQAVLDTMVPSKNAYIVKPNESMSVADGHLTIALVGSPTNENVTINVNGKEQSVVAGDVIDVAPDPSTKCQVTVRSFDMFKAVVTASCASAKAR